MLRQIFDAHCSRVAHLRDGKPYPRGHDRSNSCTLVYDSHLQTYKSFALGLLLFIHWLIPPLLYCLELVRTLFLLASGTILVANYERFDRAGIVGCVLPVV